MEGILTQRESRRLLGGRSSYHQVLVGYGPLDPGLGHGLIGDCLHFGCWVEQAGVDGAAWTKKCNPVWVILPLELPGQQWVAAIPSWKGQVLWVPFYHPYFVLSMAVLATQHCIILFLCLYELVLLCLVFYPLAACLQERGSQLSLRQPLRLFPPHPILVVISSCLCMETSPSQWSRNSKLGRAVDASSYGGLWYCLRSLFCNKQCWPAGRGGTFTFPREDEGQAS